MSFSKQVENWLQLPNNECIVSSTLNYMIMEKFAWLEYAFWQYCLNRNDTMSKLHNNKLNDWLDGCSGRRADYNAPVSFTIMVRPHWNEEVYPIIDMHLNYMQITVRIRCMINEWTRWSSVEFFARAIELPLCWELEYWSFDTLGYAFTFFDALSVSIFMSAKWSIAIPL